MDNHSQEQRKLFFVLLHQLGLNKETAIEHAKKKFNVAHLRELTTAQMDQLINVLKAKQAKPATLLSRPIVLRAWDKQLEQMLTVAILNLEDGIVTYTAGGKKGKSEQSLSNVDLMQSTGKLDYFGKEMFHYDIFQDRFKSHWLIEWSDKDLAWIACSFEDNTIRLLSTFSAVKILGNIYVMKGGEDGS